MKHLVAAAMVGALAMPGIASAQDDDNAAQALIACLNKSVRAIDDHTSDASTIAKAARLSCQAEESAAENQAGANLNPMARSMLHERFAGYWDSLAIKIVLQSRQPKSN